VRRTNYLIGCRANLIDLESDFRRGLENHCRGTVGSLGLWADSETPGEASDDLNTIDPYTNVRTTREHLNL